MTSKKNEESFSTLLNIFIVTLKIGAFTFGGGYAMIPLMQNEFVDRHKWIEEKDIVDVFAVAPSVPGVIAVNASILIGNKIAGLAGGFVAAFGSILPSFVVISILQQVYESFLTNVFVLGALRGIKASVVALMLTAVIKLSKQSFVDNICVVIAVGVIALSFLPMFGFFTVNSVYIIIGAAVLGLLLKWRRAG